MIRLDKWLKYYDSYHNRENLSINSNYVVEVKNTEYSQNEIYCTIVTTCGGHCFAFDNNEQGRTLRDTLYNYVLSEIDKGFFLDIKECE